MNRQRRLSNDERRHFLQLRRNFKGPVIGVTGSLGKTTTIEMIDCVLSTRGRVLRSHQSHGDWSTNIELLNKLGPEYDFALFEFDYQRGDRFGEMLRLIKPTIGIVTNIGDAHLNYLSRMMNTALEKSEVVKYLARNGLAILNKDDELTSALADHIATGNIIKYGLSQNARFYASDIEQLGPNGSRFKISGGEEVRIPIYSIPDVYNFLAAYSLLINLDFSTAEIAAQFQKNFIMPDGRGQIHKIKNNYYLDESYRATPRSLSKAARSLIGFKPYSRKLIFIVSDMEEAGVNIEDHHLNMGYFLSALPIDSLITVGEYARHIAKGASLIWNPDKNIFSVNSVDEVLNILDNVLVENSAISVKGIGSVASRRILKYLKTR